MIREEEIYKALIEQNIGTFNEETQDEEEDIYSGDDLISAFIRGAQWADNHPKNVWHDAKVVTPPQDEEVIVLLDDIHCGSSYKIAFGHIVDKTRCIDYNGWNIPNVVCWMPCPQIPFGIKEE